MLVLRPTADSNYDISRVVGDLQRPAAGHQHPRGAVVACVNANGKIVSYLQHLAAAHGHHVGQRTVGGHDVQAFKRLTARSEIERAGGGVRTESQRGGDRQGVVHGAAQRAAGNIDISGKSRRRAKRQPVCSKLGKISVGHER